jgi:putative zinc finger protein
MAAQKTFTKPLTDKTCKQIADLVLAYLNDELGPRLKLDFEQHLEICPDCVSFLKTYKRTVAATGSVDAIAMPAKVRNNILTFLRKRMRRLSAVLVFFFTSYLA